METMWYQVVCAADLQDGLHDVFVAPFMGDVIAVAVHHSPNGTVPQAVAKTFRPFSVLEEKPWRTPFWIGTLKNPRDVKAAMGSLAFVAIGSESVHPCNAPALITMLDEQLIHFRRYGSEDDPAPSPASSPERASPLKTDFVIDERMLISSRRNAGVLASLAAAVDARHVFPQHAMSREAAIGKLGEELLELSEADDDVHAMMELFDVMGTAEKAIRSADQNTAAAAALLWLRRNQRRAPLPSSETLAVILVRSSQGDPALSLFNGHLTLAERGSAS